MTHPAAFWDALAPHHPAIENSFLDLPSLHRIAHEVRPPALVVGAGQGLIVGELKKIGVACDGVDLSPVMIRYAKVRRGLDLVQADAKAMPFEAGSYTTIIVATGVVDFMSHDEEIRSTLNEARRIADRSGTIWVAFYKMSAATEAFLIRLGLLSRHALRHREIFEMYRLNPVQTMAWVAKQAKVGFFHATLLALRAWTFSTWQEKRNGFHMQRLFTNPDLANTLIRTAPETQPYRNELEIRNLFARLEIPIRQLETSRSCRLVRI